jgi:hypothetical protein
MPCRAFDNIGISFFTFYGIPATGAVKIEQNTLLVSDFGTRVLAS